MTMSGWKPTISLIHPSIHHTGVTLGFYTLVLQTQGLAERSRRPLRWAFRWVEGPPVTRIFRWAEDQPRCLLLHTTTKLPGIYLLLGTRPLSTNGSSCKPMCCSKWQPLRDSINLKPSESVELHLVVQVSQLIAGRWESVYEVWNAIGLAFKLSFT